MRIVRKTAARKKEQGMDEEREAESGISLGDIWRAVKRRIWIVLAITVGLTLIVSLVFGLAINPRAVEYRLRFHIVFPTGSARYPDGSPFSEREIISPEFLEEAKNSGEEFAGLDINRMIKDGAITLGAEKQEDGDTVYTLTVKAQQFGNPDSAEKFLRAAAQVPVNHIVANAQTLNYKLDVEVFENASFEEKIGLLSELKRTLLAACDGWIDLYGATYPVADRTLGNYRSELYVVFGESTKKDLESESERNGYSGLDLSSHDLLKDAVDARRTVLAEEYKLNEKIIAELEKTAVSYAKFAAITTEEDLRITFDPSGNMDVEEMKAHYKKRNAQIDYQIGVTAEGEQGVLTVANVEKYVARLSEQFGELQTAAETVARVSSSIYAKNTDVGFLMRAAEKNGGINIAVVVVGSLVLSFLLAAIVAVAIASRKKSKSAQREQESEQKE